MGQRYNNRHAKFNHVPSDTADEAEFNASRQTVESQPESVVEFNAAMEAVNEHNKQYGVGGGMARLMLGIIRDRIKVGDEQAKYEEDGFSPEDAEEIAELTTKTSGPQELIGSLKGETEFSGGLVKILGQGMFDKIGLELVDANDNELRVDNWMGDDTQTYHVPDGSLSIKLIDGKKLVDFLRAVPVDSIDDKFRENINKIIGGSLGRAERALLRNQNDPVGDEIASHLADLLDGFEKVCPDETAQIDRMKKLTEHYRQGDVREYVVAKDMQLLTEPEDQEFGPANWHGDSNAKSMTDRWQRIIQGLRFIKYRPEARETYLDAMAGALKSLDSSQAEWEKMKNREGKYSDFTAIEECGYGKGFDDVFVSVRAELDEIASENDFLL
jgi:hypothetical protein